MLIDAHQHFWRVGRNGFEWPTPELSAIYRDFGPADLAAVGAPLGLSGAVAVQSQANDADTDWLLDLAEGSPLVLGVVGWADLEAPGAPQRIAALAGRPKLRGLRPMLQNLADDAWIARPSLAPRWTPWPRTASASMRWSTPATCRTCGGWRSAGRTSPW